MKIDLGVQSFDSHGGDPSVSPVGEFLTRYLREVEPKGLEVDMTACFRTKDVPKRARGGWYADFETHLATLPSVRYQPKKNRLEIRFVSQLWAEDAMEFGDPRLPVFTALLPEVAAALADAIANHKKLRTEVSLPTLAAALAAAQAQRPVTAAQFAQFLAEEEQRAAAHVATLSPWDLLGIDWSEFHPQARERLADPFFWDCTDEHAPHGNDTGADILEAFRTWRRRNRDTPAAGFLPVILKRWEFADPVERSLRTPMAQWKRKDEDALTLYDEATVAVAFAQLKLEAQCDADVAEAARQSLARQLDPAVHAHFGWEADPEREGRLRAMQAVLAS
jgi:uncharacterized protein YfeS